MNENFGNDYIGDHEVKEIKMQDVLDEYFGLTQHLGNPQVLGFHSSEDYKKIAGRTYLKYDYFEGKKDKIIISIGGVGIHETPIKVCRSGKELKKLIESIIY